MMCPIMGKECTFPDCVAVVKRTRSGDSEDCQGGKTYWSYDYLTCKHYPDKLAKILDIS